MPESYTPFLNMRIKHEFRVFKLSNIHCCHHAHWVNQRAFLKIFFVVTVAERNILAFI